MNLLEIQSLIIQSAKLCRPKTKRMTMSNLVIMETNQTNRFLSIKIPCLASYVAKAM